jgi:hypothetical protein
LSSTITQLSLQYRRTLMFAEDVSSIDTSEETGSKETSSVTETCSFPKCMVTCSRPHELKRYIREHCLPYYIYHGHPSCNWTRYALHNHLVDKHAGVPMPELEAIMIYDVKGLVKQLLNREINVEQAVGNAQS